MTPATAPRLALARTAAILALLCLAASAVLASPTTEAAYHDGKGVASVLKDLTRTGKHAQLLDLTETPGGRKLQLLSIAPSDPDKARSRSAHEPDKAAPHDAPAVLVIANPLGTTPLATEAALRLGRMLVDPELAEHAARLTWYIVPMANPDGAARYFENPILADGRNGRAYDDDMDGDVDEDGPDDLNSDGLITTMLLPHLEGAWLLTDDDPPLPKQANSAMGEQGRYKRYREGWDDDGDGAFNEDGVGGTVIGRNFPHAFEHWTTDSGRWPASETETRAILNFAFSRPNIALVLVLSAVNTLATVPESDQTVEVGGGKYKLPQRMAERMGVKPETEFALDILVQIVRDYTGMPNLTDDDVLAFLDLGAAVHPNPKDLPWWNALSEQYKTKLTEVGLDGPRVEPVDSPPGSVEEWSYYQFGVPTFAVDFWSVPKPEPIQAEGEKGGEGARGESALTPDDMEKISRDELIALGEKKIAAMMHEQTAEEEAGGVDPDLKALATFSRDVLQPLGQSGYLDWEEVSLPDGRKALVGGEVPYALRTPPVAWIDSLLTLQLPFLIELTEWLPELAIASIEQDSRGAGVFEVKAHVVNKRRIAYPSGQGVRCKRPPPVVITLEGADLLEGRARQTITAVPGLGSAHVRWLIRGEPGTELTIHMTTPSAGSDQKTFVLDREGDER
jgi:hypothetical protein